MRTRKNDAQLVIRLPADVVARLDQAADEMSIPGSPMTRAGVARVLILRALEGVGRSRSGSRGG